MYKKIIVLIAVVLSVYASPKKGYLGITTGFAPVIGGDYVSRDLNKEISHGGILGFEYTRPVTSFLRTGGILGIQNTMALGDYSYSRTYTDIAFSLESRNIFTPLYSKGNTKFELNADIGVHLYSIFSMDEYFTAVEIEDPLNPGDSITVLKPYAGSGNLRTSLSAGAAYTLPAKRNVSVGTFVNCQVIGLTENRINKVVFGFKFNFHEKKEEYNPNLYNRFASNTL